MTKSERIIEKREFFRMDFNSGFQYQNCSPVDPKTSADTKNISQSGILFQTSTNPPAISSILWMNMDLRTLNICKEIENRALVFNNGVLGRVVRVEEDVRTGKHYDVGVCFLTRDQQNSREVQAILSQLNL